MTVRELFSNMLALGEMPEQRIPATVEILMRFIDEAGFAVVPKEPTPEMINSFCHTWPGHPSWE